MCASFSGITRQYVEDNNGLIILPNSYSQNMKIKIHPGKENPIHAGQYITSSVLWQCVVTNASRGTNGGLGC